MTRPAGHLGPAASAFVDGSLDAVRRDEVLVHLTHCAPCRAELAVQRGLRCALRQLPGPGLSEDLANRLLAVAAQEPLGGSLGTGLSEPRRYPRYRRHRRHRRGLRRAAVSGALLALGLGGSLGLAGPAPTAPVAPVDPTSARFVRDHTSAATEVPFDEPDVVSASLQRAP